ncbi:MAG: Glycosyl transferases group 1 [Pelotomaculum sp. PtaB.Bin104]|nr:MAG: Glycosyl transferases group 1 [Pelotomaculum sp. PtaB.Bin104]
MCWQGIKMTLTKRNEPLVLIACDYYFPGYKGGGPIRTLANLVERLGDEFRFKIITRDRDFGDRESYPGISVNSWQNVGKAEVFYSSPQNLSLLALYRLLKAADYDVIYLNSFFSPFFTIMPLLLRQLRLIPQVPVIVAPRGEFSCGALALKGLKKRIYLKFAKMLGLYRSVIWQASSEYEEVDIHRWFGDNVSLVVAPDLPPSVNTVGVRSSCREKTAGSLKIIFISRISRMKNLDGALTMLKGLNGKVQFNIYGPLEDMDYWMKCKGVIGLLPPNIEVQYRGVAPHNQVYAVMQEHDLFFLPTLGENFGHVILEALVAGCPVLISNKTPWCGLEEKGVGWDLPLEQPEKFRTVLQKFLDMDTQTHRLLSMQAKKYGLQYLQDEKVIKQNHALFKKAIVQ